MTTQYVLIIIADDGTMESIKTDSDRSALEAFAHKFILCNWYVLESAD